MTRYRYLLLALFSMAMPIHAATTIVKNGEMSGSIFLGGDDDRILVEAGGAIESAVNFEIGAELLGANVLGSNSGSITMTGEAAGGMRGVGTGAEILNMGSITMTNETATGINLGGTDVRGSNTGDITALDINSVGMLTEASGGVLTNSGAINMFGDNSFGIQDSGASNMLIINRGAIFTTGASGHGVSLRGANQTMVNTGSIVTTNTQADGIRSIVGANQVVDNRGTIVTFGGGGDAILVAGITPTAFNSGTIITSGGGAHGLRSGAAGAILVNSGLVSVSGPIADGVFSVTANNVLTNSGTIRSSNYAINFSGADSTVNLLRGSSLQGAVRSVNPLNLNVETGLNLALTIEGDFAALGIDAPFAQVGSVVGVVDPTGLSLQADVLADLSDTILDGIYRQRIGCCTSCGCGAWIQGVGSYRKRSHNDGVIGYHNSQGGFLLGYGGNQLGIFGGATFGRAEVDKKTQTAVINTYLGGVTYEGRFGDTYFGAALALGYVDWGNYRYVMNNLAPGGVETAKASVDGLFVSPELTVARQIGMFFCKPLITSFTLRYAGLFLGDYEEKGSLTNFSVRDREVDLLTTRFEAALPFDQTWGECCRSLEPYVGLFGRYQVGGTHIQGELLGQSLEFGQFGPNNLVAFFLGFRGVQSIGCLDLTLNLEGSFDNERGSRILGEGGLAWRF